MVSFTAASILGLAAIVSAQTAAYNPATQAQTCHSSYTVCTSSNTAVDTCKSQLSTCEQTCSTKYDSCRGGYDSNKAQCAAEYAGCLGRNPFDADGSLGGASNGTGAGGVAGPVVVTTVVSSYVTVCPMATTFTENGQKYVGTQGQTITVTDCPCTRTVGVNYATSTPATPATPNQAYGNNNATGTHTPVKYTGGASVLGAGFGAIAGAAGILAFAL